MKRTKDLTEEEILKFDKQQLVEWMNRVMARLNKLIDRQSYDRLTRQYVSVCRGGLEYAKRGLVQLVKIIREKWQDPPLRIV